MKDQTPIERVLLGKLWSYAKYIIALSPFAVVVWISVIGIGTGSIPTSETQFQMGAGHSTFYLEAEATGKTVFTGAENVSEELGRYLLDTTFDTPDAAIDAATGDTYPHLSPLDRALYLFGAKPAEAHAVLLCTTRDGVISRSSGNRFHETYHRFDRDGYRYTKTYHVLWTGTSYLVEDVFYGKINKRYC